MTITGGITMSVRSKQQIKKAKAEKHNLQYEANKQLEEKLQKMIQTA